MNTTLRSSSSRLVPAIVALALTVVSCYIHYENFTHAGALWRDEVNTVELASEPLSSTYANLQYDSFPLLWFIVLRNFMHVAGSDDFALRALGMGVGLLTLVAIWMNARLFRHHAPVLAIFMIGINGAVIRYGDSLRGYGLGVLTGTLMFGALWNLTRRMTAATIALATLSALLAVHSLFYNAVFLFAVCMGGVAVMYRRRSIPGVMAFLGIGVLCALSLWIYIPSLRSAGSWNELVRYDVRISWFWSKWGETLEEWGNPLQLTGRIAARFLWTLASVGGCAIAAVVLRRKSEEQNRKEIALFCLTTLVVGTIGYVIFLRALRYATDPWYYLILMVITACCLDPLYGMIQRAEVRLAIVVALAVLGFLAINPVLMAIRRPQTNINLLAAKISRESAPEDLIFIFPWQNGISFQRYYRGPVRWQTVPPLDFHRWHRYDRFKAVIADSSGLATFLGQVEKQLQAGGRVWIVAPTGFLENPHPTLYPRRNPRLPKGDHLWRMRLSVLLSNNRRRVELFQTGSARGVNENLILDVGAPAIPKQVAAETTR